MFKNLNPWVLGVSGHQSEIIELALTYGFRGMDINIVEFATRVRLRGMPYARRLIDSAKIRVGTFRLPLEWDVADAEFNRELDKLGEYARVAAEIGCTRCICAIEPAGDKRPYHENFEFHRRRFGEICRVMEPSGVILGVGFRAGEGLRKGRAFQFIHDLDALLLLLSMVAAPNIGVVVDLWDLYVSGASIEALRGLPVHQIVAVQLSDVAPGILPGELTEQHRLLPAVGGQVDAAAALALLAEMGYAGPVTPIAHRGTFESARRDRIVKQAGEAMERLWRAAGLGADGRPSVSAAKSAGNP
ncbi:MAG: sugar phosphate isomerase/epimerase family protein [Thermoguttaceae bacterium]